VDDGTVAGLMGMLVSLDLDFVMTGHALWGCFPQVPKLDIYEVRRSDGSCRRYDPRPLGRPQPAPAQLGMTPALRDYLTAESLMPLWTQLRKRLEGNGHAIRGSVRVELDDDGADRAQRACSGAGQPRHGTDPPGADLDTSLRSSAADRGLVSVVADLTGGPLRNLPAERETVRAGRQELWAELDQVLAEHGLAVCGMGGTVGALAAG